MLDATADPVVSWADVAPNASGGHPDQGVVASYGGVLVEAP
jgi:hypothetical protein